MQLGNTIHLQIDAQQEVNKSQLKSISQIIQDGWDFALKFK